MTALTASVWHFGTWVLVGLLSVATLLNVASSSPWETPRPGPVPAQHVVPCTTHARSRPYPNRLKTMPSEPTMSHPVPTALNSTAPTAACTPAIPQHVAV